MSKMSQIHLETYPSIWILFNWCQMGAGFNCDKNKKGTNRKHCCSTGRDEFWLVRLNVISRRCVQWISKNFFFSRGGGSLSLGWLILKHISQIYETFHLVYRVTHTFHSSLFLWCILWHFFLCLFTPFFLMSLMDPPPPRTPDEFTVSSEICMFLHYDCLPMFTLVSLLYCFYFSGVSRSS